MNSNLTSRLVAVFVALQISAFAQVDGPKFAADIRSKFGNPLARQTFRIPAGEMVVDYAANGNVCRIKLPAMGPNEGQAFLLKLLPLTLRGKELRRMANGGLNSSSSIEYENVAIAEEFRGGERNGVTLVFITEKCQDRPAIRPEGRASPSPQPQIQSVQISPNSTVIPQGQNFGVALESVRREGEKNYDASNHKVRIRVYYRADPNERIIESNKYTAGTTNEGFWLSPNLATPIQIGQIGIFVFTLKNPQIDSATAHVQSALLDIVKAP